MGNQRYNGFPYYGREEFIMGKNEKRRDKKGYSGLVFKTNYLSFYNESMLRRERKPLPHSNQCYAA